MKNKLFLAIACCLLSSALVGCGGGNDTLDPTTIEQVRTFASSMKKDINDFNGLIYESSFKEKYSVASRSENNEQTSDYSLQYSAEGEVMSGYALNVNDQGSADVTAALIYNEGTGYFAGRQQETVTLSHAVTSKSNQEKVKSTRANYAFTHSFGVQFDGNELYAMGNTSVTNKLVAANSESGEFKGKIAKSALNTFTESAIESAVSKVLYLQAWSSIASFKEAIVDYFKTLDLSTDAKVKQFLDEKQLRISETKESLKINFVLDGAKILSQITGRQAKVSASVVGSAEINKASKFVTYSDFDFKSLFLALLQKGADNVSVDACQLKTVLTSFPASSKKLEGESTFREYGVDQAAEFATGFEKYVVPSLENVEVEG